MTADIHTYGPGLLHVCKHKQEGEDHYRQTRVYRDRVEYWHGYQVGDGTLRWEPVASVPHEEGGSDGEG